MENIIFLCYDLHFKADYYDLMTYYTSFIFMILFSMYYFNMQTLTQE